MKSLRREDVIFYVAEAAVLLLLWAITVAQYVKAPETVPIHFNLAGDADRMGPRTTMLLVALVGTVAAVGIEAMALWSPASAVNIPGVDVKKKQSPMAGVYARRLCHLMALLLLLLMICVVCLMAGGAYVPQSFGLWPTFVIISMTFLVIGYYCIKIARLR